MIYIPQAVTDAWLMEDINGGDLTTRILNIGDMAGTMTFLHRQGGCVSGIAPAAQMLRDLGMTVILQKQDGSHVAAGDMLLRVQGTATALHQGWKAAQNVLEWSCGVSSCVDNLLQQVRHRLPHGQVACTRKAIPGTRLLGTQAILAAGGMIHRAGCAETLLVFANHRRFLNNKDDWVQIVTTLRNQCPERKVALEADTPEEAIAALQGQPDILQLDKFTPAEARIIAEQAQNIAPNCTLALTGGINATTIENYLDCGISLFITSAPWYSQPADIQVILTVDDV